jgi:O-antigen ligase
MKSKAKPKTKKPGVSLFEIVLLALPFLALIPNNFIPPLLGHVGLATQEFVFACAGLVFAGLGMVQIVQAGQKQFEISREDWLMFAALSGFILWQAISLSWAPTVYDGVRVTGIWLGFAIFLIAGVICLRQRSAEWLRGALSVISVILAISVIVEPLIFGPERRGIFFNHGISAELLVTLLPFHILTYLTTEKRWLAVASLAISGLSAVALLMGLRRGALIGAAIILIAVGFAAAFKLIKPPSKTRVRIAVGLMVLAAAVVGARYRQEIVYRIQGATQLQSVEGGLTTRLRGYITAWEMGKANALIGVGAAGYPSLYGIYRQRFVSNPQYAKIAEAAGPEDFDEIRSPLVHNEYLETFVELGIVGLLLFFAFWALVARGLWRRSRNADHPMIIGSLLGLVAFGVSSFTSGFSLRYTPQAFILPCVLCVGFAFGRTGGRANDEQKPSISLPRAAATAIAALALVASAMLAARAFNVLASQRLQGRTSWAVPQLDFNFFPEHPAGNETLARRYEQVIELDSENAGAHLGYGLLLYQMKRPEKAIPHVEFALNHGYSRPFAYVLLAFAHEQAGDLARGSQVLSECAASYPQSFFVRAAYAEMLRKEGKVGQAGEQQNAMYTLNAHEAQSWELLIRKRPDEAAKEAQQRGLIPPDRLWPRLAATLVGARAFHYLK